MAEKIKVTVWNEYRHELKTEAIGKIYPEGIHGAIAKALKLNADMEVGTATLDEPEHGLTQEVLDATDVLIWWGHMAHSEVKDEIAARVQKRVLEGMGLIVLHSGHFSKPFMRLMGTGCTLLWREMGEKERVWTIDPSHPIAEGIDQFIEVPHSEMYGERFDIPTPQQIVFISWYEGGEVFRSGCTFERGMGRIFYFSPGHETYPIYHQAEIQKVITNAVRWTAARVKIVQTCHPVKPLETITPRD